MSTTSEDLGVRGASATRGRRIATLKRQLLAIGGRLTWGAADQALSSTTNFVVTAYIAHVLGAVSFGAFSIAFLAYTLALNVSRGLATDPLLVRFSHTDTSTWRREVADCTGTAVLVGLTAGACAVVASALLRGALSSAFLALGLTLPGLLVQDSWRYSFFAQGRGSRAMINDGVCVAALLLALGLVQLHGHATVFWCVLAWGGVASIGAALAPLQANVRPRVWGAKRWLVDHRDLGPRYVLEGGSSAASGMVQRYAVAFILGLAVAGYLQAAKTVMGPFSVIYFGMGLVALPEATRALRRSPHHMVKLCITLSICLSLLAAVWGVTLLVLLPRGLGHLLLGSLWRPTYPLLPMMTLAFMTSCFSMSAGMGLHALGVARRSLRMMLLASGISVLCGIAGAFVDGAVGVAAGLAIAGVAGALLYWNELRSALREHAALHEVVPTALEAEPEEPSPLSL